MSQKEPFIIDMSVKDLFFPLINSAIQDLQFSMPHTSETYLMSLLEKGLFTETVFAKNQGTGLFDEPMIAERFLAALQEEQETKKHAQLKQLGNSILFKSGFFSDALKRKLCGLNYQIQMGSSVFSILHSNSHNPVYKDLSLRFSGYVDLISYIGQKINLNRSDNVLELFDKYLETGSKSAKSKLIELGYAPEAIKKVSNQ